MKKNRFILAFIAALMLMMSLFCISASAAGFEYTESDTRKIIEGIVYDKCGTDENTYYSVRALATSYEKAQELEKAEILTEIDGYPVTHIDFARIDYPNKNFEYPLIKEFVIPDSVTYFSAFGLINLEEIIIPDNVTELGKSAFWNMKKIEEITLHEGITVIPDSAFSGCKSLKKVEFKGEITELGEGAFSGCENLVTVTLPKTITEIKDHTFSKCGKLREVIHEGKFTYFGDNAFYKCKKLRKMDVSDAEYIGCDAFSGCFRLEEVIFSDTKDVIIGCQAFKETGIEEIYIPKGVDFYCECSEDYYVSDNRFEKCRLLEKVVFEDRNDETFFIGHEEFKDCDALESVVLPESVGKITIGESAFLGCKYLETINLSNVGIISALAFKNCERLSGVVTLPKLTIMSCQAFFNTAIEEVTLPAVVRYMCGCDDDYGPTTGFPGNQFQNCDKLKKVTFLDADVEGTYTKKITIPTEMFYFCDNLETVTFPSNVDKIVLEDYAFGYCYNLKTVNNTESIRQYGGHAFFECHYIEKIAFSNKSVTIGEFAFSGCRCLKTLKNTESITSIGEKAFMFCDSLTSFKFSETGKVKVDARAFYKCPKLAKVTGSESIVSLGDAAFAFCESLKSFTLGKNLKTTGEKVFHGCKKLSKVTILNTKTAPTFGRKAFYSTADGIKFVVPNSTVSKSLKTNLKNTNTKNAKITVAK